MNQSSNPFCAHTERIVVLEVEMQELKSDNKEILATLKEMHGELTKYKGFLGGIAFVGSCVIVAFTLFKDVILHKIGIT
jgi:ABC-type antimicrobial peptide transport system permease subunit